MEERPLYNAPLVSVITVNYNGVAVTKALLDSLQQVTYPNLEVIVVDNASTEAPDSIVQAYPEVILIRNRQNKGFAGGNNAGFLVAKGAYLLMLNNDTEVAPDFLEPLVRRMQSDTSIGLVGPKIKYHHTPDTIQYAGSTEINPYTGRGNFIGHNQKDDGRYDAARPTALTHGAAMLFSREVLEEVGLMEDQYFLYYEEIDFCERIKRAGYRIWYEPKSVVYHKESMTVGKESPLKTYYMTRNRLLFLRRNVRGATLVWSTLFFLFLSWPKNSFKYLIQRKLSLVVAYGRGVLWHLFHWRLPKTQMV